MIGINIFIESGKFKMGKVKYYTEEERLEAIRLSKRKYQQKWKESNPEYIKTWREENKEKVLKSTRNYRKVRRVNDPLFKFLENTRNLINGSFKRRECIKPRKTEELLGCSIDEFRTYIISKCPEGVTVENFSRFEYHIDHIVPLASASSTEEIIKLCHYTNLQPLWCSDNLKKSDKT